MARPSSTLESRIASFEAFLMAKFGTIEVTKEQLITSNPKRSNVKLPKTNEKGIQLLQPNSLYDFYARKENHLPNETALFAMLSDTGYAAKLDITNEDSLPLEKQLKVRKASLEAFLQMHISNLKSNEDGFLNVTKEQLLCIIAPNLENPGFKLPKTNENGIQLIQANSLYEFYSRKENRLSNDTILFAMFRDTGYADKLGITNEDTKLSAEQLPWVRKATLNAFLQNHFPKLISNEDGFLKVTKEQLLCLVIPNFQHIKRLPKNNQYGIQLLQPQSLINFYSRKENRLPNETILFAMFRDTGYADKLGITNKDTKLSIEQMLWVRKASLDAFLQMHFPNLKATEDGFLNVTKEQILCQVNSNLRNPGFKLPKTNEKGIQLLQPNSLYDFYARKENRLPNESVLFAMLRDTGYADRFGITNEDTIRAPGKPIVILDSRTIGNGAQIDADVPPDARTVSKPDTYEIQVAMSTETKRFEIKTPMRENTTHIVSVLDQAIYGAFGLIPIVSEKYAKKDLFNCRAGETVAIKSLYPLDDAFLSGMRAMGFEVVEKNLRFTTSDRGLYGALHSQSVTIAIRREETSAEVDKILFENALAPDMYAAHTLGAIARWADRADSEAALHFSVTFALEFLLRIQKVGAIDEARYEKLEQDYIGKLAGKESKKMGSFGLEGSYPPRALDLSEPMNREAHSRLKAMLAKRVDRLNQAFRRQTLAAKLR